MALIIRERGDSVPRVVTYANDSAGSCAELVESVPFNLDGGFFYDVDDGSAIETGGAEVESYAVRSRRRICDLEAMA